MIIVITGPQSSGKGTQAQILAKQYGFRHISTGDILRAEVKEGTPEGLEADSYMKNGQLVPFELNNSILKKALDKYKNETILLDGYPRSVEQAEHLLKIAEVKCVVYINISDEIAVQRACNRRICTATNKIYILDKLTEQDYEDCKIAGGEIVQRTDDNPNTIRARLKIYHEQTSPCLKYLEKHKIPVIEVNGERPIPEVDVDVQKELKKMGLI
jgi:adenylate kinase